MARRLLPLGALRVLEAAARLGSFKAAAAELRVTPAAVSHQIKELEARLGQPLFRRVTRGLVLTERLRAALPALSQGLDLLERAGRTLETAPAGSQLRVAVEPSLAAAWLVPRLPDFRAHHPQIEVWLAAGFRVVDLAREPIDCAIRYLRRPDPALSADLLFEDEVIPVCSPQLLAGRRVAAPRDLAGLTLIHIDPEPAGEDGAGWPDWLEQVGARGIDGRAGPHFNLDSMAIGAAIDGQGVALVSRALVADALTAGRLVQPLPQGLRVGAGWYLVALPERLAEPPIAAFRAWLVATAAASGAIGEGA